MRITYKEFKASARVLWGVEYQCSNCRRSVFSKYCIEETVKEVAGKNAISPKGNLEEAAADKLHKKVDRILEEYRNGRYDTAAFNIECPTCGYKEVWSKLSASSGLGCFIKFIYVVLIIFGLCSLVGKPTQAWICIGIGVGIYLINFWISSLIIKQKYKKISMLPRESLPKIVNNVTPRERIEFDFRKAENKRCIYSSGHHVQGCEYTEVILSQYQNVNFYTVSVVYDKMNAGGYSEPVPQRYIINGKVDADGLLKSLGYIRK